MKKTDLKKKFLSPFFAGYLILAVMAAYYIICYLFSFKFGFFDIEDIGVSETLTYLFYGFGAGVLCCHIKDYFGTERQGTFFALGFLYTAALFREMGIQHWLTTHDSVVTKTRFFLSPNNPLYEKIIAGSLILLVIAVLALVVIKNFKWLKEEFFKFQTIPWTVAAFGILSVITQIADRFPANYFKATGAELSGHTLFILKILEEGGESLLPLIFAIAIVQYHFILRKNHSA